MLVDRSNVHEVCTYHAPDAEQIPKYQAIREAEEAFIRTMLENAPQCADLQAAIRKVREAAMSANMAIALHGLI